MIIHNIKGQKTSWDKVYNDSNVSGGWAYLSQLIIRTFINETNVVNQKKIIEAGSGSGRNSAKLAQLGAIITLLDYSDYALQKAKEFYQQNNIPAAFVNGDIFNIPFDNNTFDIVWNSGVIEHWTGDQQVSCLKEMLRISQNNGIVITFNPNARSIFHVIGKKLLMLFNSYAYIDEINIKTLKNQAKKAGGKLVKKEYSIGFFVLFVGLFIQLAKKPIVGGLSRFCFTVLNKFFASIDRSFLGKPFYKLDQFFSFIFGGYLLVSVIKKHSEYN